ncbi:hypothetical protein FI667_g644, partial [Globisporangium splendens]
MQTRRLVLVVATALLAAESAAFSFTSSNNNWSWGSQSVQDMFASWGFNTGDRGAVHSNAGSVGQDRTTSSAMNSWNGDDACGCCQRTNTELVAELVECRTSFYYSDPDSSSDDRGSIPHHFETEHYTNFGSDKSSNESSDKSSNESSNESSDKSSETSSNKTPDKRTRNDTRTGAHFSIPKPVTKAEAKDPCSVQNTIAFLSIPTIQ